MNKLHLGCGTIYLKGWINIDLNLPHHHLTIDRPDLMKTNGTTLDNYYKEDVGKKDFLKGTFHKKEVVCDMVANVKNLPFENESVDEMLAVQLFEHFGRIEAEELLDYWWGLLKFGGSLRLHVPDILGIYKQFQKDNDEDWMIRQIFGSQKNEFGFHKFGYTEETLSQLLLKHHFKNVEFVENINNYPSIAIKAYK